MLLGVTESDAFALSMIAILTLGLGFVFVILVAILRNGARRNTEVDRLIDEVSEQKESQPAGPAATETQPREPWEKPADWWREGS